MPGAAATPGCNHGAPSAPGGYRPQPPFSAGVLPREKEALQGSLGHGAPCPAWLPTAGPAKSSLEERERERDSHPQPRAPRDRGRV